MSPDDLRDLAADLGKPPHRIAGIPAGIISADDLDVTDEAFAALAQYPELAVLVADMADALRDILHPRTGPTGFISKQHGGAGWPDEIAEPLLARLEALT